MGVAGAEQVDGTRSGDALRFGDVVPLRAQKMPLGLMGSGGLVGTALQWCSSSDGGPGLSCSAGGRRRSGRDDGWPPLVRT